MDLPLDWQKTIKLGLWLTPPFNHPETLPNPTALAESGANMLDLPFEFGRFLTQKSQETESNVRKDDFQFHAEDHD